MRQLTGLYVLDFLRRSLNSVVVAAAAAEEELRVTGLLVGLEPRSGTNEGLQKFCRHFIMFP
jgi:hypothetical protein